MIVEILGTVLFGLLIIIKALLVYICVVAFGGGILALTGQFEIVKYSIHRPIGYKNHRHHLADVGQLLIVMAGIVLIFSGVLFTIGKVAIVLSELI